MNRITKMAGYAEGKVLSDPKRAAFMSEEDSSKMEMNLSTIAMRLLAEERAKREDPTLAKIDKENPSKVEDKTKDTKLQDTFSDENKTPVEAKKSSEKEPKFSDLTGYVPAEVKRDEKDEVPEFNNEDFDESVHEWEEWDEKFEKEHISKLAEIIREFMAPRRRVVGAMDNEPVLAKENKPKLGSGARFKALKKKVAKGGASNPGAVAAAIGRKKYGKAKFQKMAAAGKKKS